MKTIFHSAMFIASVLWFSACSEPTTEANFHVIPAPQTLTEQPDGGSFILGSDVKIIYPEGNEAMERNAQFLGDYLLTVPKICSDASGVEAKGNILLAIDPSVSEKPEGYRLKVTSDGVVITGASEAGVFYGIQTLRKSVGVFLNATTLPAVEISDAPRFDYRGAHFDVSRHFFTVDEVKTFIDMMALHNMNRMHWHLTDDQGWRLEIKKYPGLTEIGSKRKETVIGHNSGKYDGIPYGGFYTQDEVRDIIEYAAQRYITIIPEIDLPGHMQAALAAYPHLGCTGGPYEVWTIWGVSDDVLCAGNDDVLTFIDDVLAEVIDIFPSEYIHIGGDECPKTRWKECPKCQARAKALGIKGDKKHTTEEYLQSFIINHAEKFLNQHGRQMIGWDETLEGGLAPNATVMSWRGEGGGIEAARQHHDVIMTPNTYLYFDYYQTKDTENEPDAIGGYLPVERVYSYEPMPSALTPEEQKYIKGVQANHWTEYMPTFAQVQYMSLPRWAALAEVQWSQPEKKNYECFLKRLPQLINLYDALGYNYATHVFDVSAEFEANAETSMLDIRMKTIDNAPIHYTLDGSQPTQASPVAGDVVSINQNCTFKAVAIRPNGESRVLSEEVAFSRSTCKPTTANQPVNRQYQFKGITTLTDGLKGNRNYKTGRWIAFYRNDMDVTIDLKEPTEISSLAFTTNVEKGDWTFDVRGITVEVSDDGKNFTKVFEESYPAMKETDRNGLYDHKITLKPVTTRYVHVVGLSERSIPEWHGGKGNAGFLFVDEITIE